MSVRARQGIQSKELRWSRASKIGARPATLKGLPRLLALTGGLPRVVGAKDPKDQAIRLLRIAAEVEHALMVQYLYAAFLLGPDADDKYRSNLVTIAKQEMGHLITVQNLLRLLEVPPHLDRDSLLPSSGKEPAAFVLEPVTPESLAKYVVIESPLDEVIKTNRYDWEVYNRALRRLPAKSLTHLARVGVLYAAIYWLFMKTDDPEADEPWPLKADDVLEGSPDFKGAHLKDDDFSPQQDIAKVLATPNDWNINVDTIYVDQTLDRVSAKKALFRISSQGEGISNDPGSTSHFQRFLELFASADQKSPEILRVPMKKSGLIETEAGQNIARCFNTRYQILLLLIDLSLRLERDNGDIRSALCMSALQEMTAGISDIASGMLELTDGPSKGPVAPPFELPGGPWPKESLPNAAAVVKQLRLLVSQSGQITKTIGSNWPGWLDELMGPMRNRDSVIESTINQLQF
jgi:rubrerythrin